jgi:hypothetical protein
VVTESHIDTVLLPQPASIAHVGRFQVEGQMSAPRLIHSQRLTPLVAEVSDRLDIGAGPVRRRTDDQRTCRGRMFFPGPRHLLRRRRVRQLELGVIPQPDSLGLHPAEDQAGHDGLVRVPADQQITAAAGHRQHMGGTE